jgi:hypothetical protein
MEKIYLIDAKTRFSLPLDLYSYCWQVNHTNVGEKDSSRAKG